MAASWRWEGADLHLNVRVQPRSAADQVVGIVDGAVRVRLTSPPVDGKANRSLLRLIARAFGVAPSRVELVGGDRGRGKHLVVHGPVAIPEWLGSAEISAPPSRSPG